jgi:hypothetical protein
MSTVHIVTEAPGAASAGSGGAAASAVGRWLALAAAPAFALMALWSELLRAHPDLLHRAMRSSAAMSGMTLMSLLMSVFHSSPWLTLIASRRKSAHRQARSRLKMQPLSMRSERAWPPTSDRSGVIGTASARLQRDR